MLKNVTWLGTAAPLDMEVHNASQARYCFLKVLSEQLPRGYGENVHLAREVEIDVSSYNEFELA